MRAPALKRSGPRRKEATHERIVEAAARAIRRSGYGGTGVVDIMKDAGLTHGGFYAHFKSKDDLVAAAIGQMFEEARERFREWTGGKERPDALRTYINAYVSAAHRDRPETGCAIAALSSDIYRQGKKARAAYDAGVAGLVGSISNLLDEGEEAKTRALAVSMLAEMTGAVAAARAVSDRKLSDEILAGARRALRTRAGVPPSQHEGNGK
jgi:TetR/AcrR family transcriptional repressor of nem operon